MILMWLSLDTASAELPNAAIGNISMTWLAFGSITIGALGSLNALWKSRKLSPDSIMRRFYWTGGSIGCILLLLSQLPDLARGLFGSIAFSLAWLVIAFLRSNHIKIGGRVYAAFDLLRQPDRPPALASDDPGSEDENLDI